MPLPSNTHLLTPDQLILWEKIAAFQIDDPTSDFTFTDRLARENGWKLEFTYRAIEDYKRFIFLMCVCDHPLTPSDQIDQVWHLHLLYTESYWIDLCKHTLGREIHHGPTKGGSDEKQKFTDWYAETKKRYAEIFQEQPSEDLWPSSSIRFGELNFTRVNLHRNWVIPKLNRSKKR